MTDLGYWTYQATGNAAPTAAVSFQLQVAPDGNVTGSTAYTTPVFEPYWQGSNPTPATWQQWNLMTGRFWSSKGVGGQAGACDKSCTVATDRVTFGTAADTTVFNFEHPVLPTNKDQCQKDDWETNFAAGQFKNQGDCVSSVASDGGRTRQACPSRSLLTPGGWRCNSWCTTTGQSFGWQANRLGGPTGAAR